MNRFSSASPNSYNGDGRFHDHSHGYHFMMFHRGLRRALSWLLALSCASILIAAPGNADDPRVRAFRASSLNEKLASPRQCIQTLCFSVDGYDKMPDLIADAVACLEIDAKDGLETGVAELLAIQLEEILDDLSLPFHTLTGGVEGKPFVFCDEEGIRIVLARGSDNCWRFDKATVAKIPTMRRLAAERAKKRQVNRAALREGMEDPTATMTTFLEHAVSGDFQSAALRLDLSELSAEQRRMQGPYLAWKLAAIMQRRGYLYRQDVPVDPDGPPYTWSADSAGRITVERIHQPGGRDTWLFAKATVAAIESMWKQEQAKQPDVRYVLLRGVVPPPPRDLTAAEANASAGEARPATVPEDFASPRSMLRAFFRTVDEAEFDDAKQKEAYGFLDLTQFPPEDLPLIGPKRVLMLETVLRKLKPDVSTISDHWSAPPQAISGPNGLRVEIVRQSDGRWRFSSETAARLPMMYESIGGQEKGESERQHGLANPREALVTFFTAVNQRDDAQAASCLDLSEIPASARANLGPVLAFKLKYAIDRIGRVYLQEIPNDPEGPRLVLYRGSLGRIDLARREDHGAKVWGFTSSTVRQIEEMFGKVLDLPPDEKLAHSSAIRLAPDFYSETGVWLRVHVPPPLRSTLLGLQLYQWLGLAIAFVLACVLAWLARAIAIRALCRFFLLGAAPAERAEIAGKLRAFALLVFVLVAYKSVKWLDLPASIAGEIYFVQKLVITAVLTWAGFQAINLITLFYKHSEQLRQHRGLGDLVVPFTSNVMKVVVIVGSTIYLVGQFGQEEALTRFLAGLGIAGLGISLAAQDSLKNLFGTLLLISDRSFRIGDRIMLGDKEGVVEQVGFRSTKLRTPDDSVLILPNGLLANGVIDNLGLRTYRRVRMPFSVMVATPFEKVESLRDSLRAYLNEHPRADHKRVHVHIQRIGKAGIELEIWAYFQAVDLEGEKQAREELTTELIRLSREQGVELTLEK